MPARRNKPSDRWDGNGPLLSTVGWSGLRRTLEDEHGAAALARTMAFIRQTSPARPGAAAGARGKGPRRVAKIRCSQRVPVDPSEAAPIQDMAPALIFVNGLCRADDSLADSSVHRAEK